VQLHCFRVFARILANTAATKEHLADVEARANAAEILLKDQDQLPGFSDFPAQHWIHLRTSNAIESAFSTIKARIRTTRCAGSRKAGFA